MLVNVITPEDFVGEIIGDINAKRGRIEHIRNANQKQEITAHVPMSELFGYATRLRSISQGRAVYTMEYLKHEKTPANIQEIIEVAKEEEIKVIFVQKQFSTHNAEVIAREINGRVVQIDPLSYNWAENLKLIVDEIVKSYSN